MSDSGFFLLDKPPGMTSSQLVSKIKRLAGLKKIGHTGTLDKFAEGLMILPFGTHTTFSANFLGKDKSYWAEVAFGQTTDSGDPEGNIILDWPEIETERYFNQNRQLIEDAIAAIPLTTEQSAPKISALKVNGRRQSDLFRQGVDFKEKIRPVRIYNLSWENLASTGFTFQVSVSSGTYIRKIVMDLAEKTGLPMHTRRLKRLSVGDIFLHQANTVEDFEAGNFKKWQLDELLHFPGITMDESESMRIKNGIIVPVPGLERITGQFVIRNHLSELLAFCETVETDNTKKYRYVKVFREP